MSTSMFREVMDQKTTLSETLRQFQPEVSKIRQLIAAKPLFLIGTGASYNACALARDAFILHARVFPQVLYAGQALTYPAEAFRGAAVLLASQSGKSHETKLLCEHLKQAGATLIAVTMDCESPLAKAAQGVMCVDIGPEISSATKTYTAQALMMDMLAVDGDLTPFATLEEDMCASLDTMVSRVDDLAGPITGNSYGYIAGVGALAPAASQVSLMLKEKCFLCYEGMSINEFRHGTVEAAEKGMNVILMCTGEAGFRETQPHIAFLNEIGARVFLVHDSGEDTILPAERKIRLTCHVAPEFAGIVFAGFGQVLAERIASRAGYRVDGFRYLAKIVENY